ncbi:hypothetical protein, partial [Bradyrhizobium cosmicum]|uniref:hypothetical protein n=1 Tax=Bradyrhizobium cosmicum TaxID=1404864 RepID=UPI0028EB8105
PRKVRESIRGHGFISPAATRTVKMHQVRAFVQTDDIAEIGVRTLYHTKALQIDARFGSKCEELNLSKSRPPCLNKRTSWSDAATSPKGQAQTIVLGGARVGV